MKAGEGGTMTTLRIDSKAHLGPLSQTADGKIHLNQPDGLGRVMRALKPSWPPILLPRNDT